MAPPPAPAHGDDRSDSDAGAAEDAAVAEAVAMTLAEGEQARTFERLGLTLLALALLLAALAGLPLNPSDPPAVRLAQGAAHAVIGSLGGGCAAAGVGGGVTSGLRRGKVAVAPRAGNASAVRVGRLADARALRGAALAAVGGMGLRDTVLHAGADRRLLYGAGVGGPACRAPRSAALNATHCAVHPEMHVLSHLALTGGVGRRTASAREVRGGGGGGRGAGCRGRGKRGTGRRRGRRERTSVCVCVCVCVCVSSFLARTQTHTHTPHTHTHNSLQPPQQCVSASRAAGVQCKENPHSFSLVCVANLRPLCAMRRSLGLLPTRRLVVGCWVIYCGEHLRVSSLFLSSFLSLSIRLSLLPLFSSPLPFLSSLSLLFSAASLLPLFYSIPLLSSLPP